MASKAKNNSNVKVSLEDYLLLLHSRSHLKLTVTHLNQIIHMHGYKKIHKTDDVMADLSDLNCSCNNVNQYQSPPPRNDAVRFQQYSPPAAPDSAAHSVVVNAPFPAKRRSARKRRRTAKVADLVNFSFP
ncbi:hypothetical protein ACLB2K_063219 [Fragaria x ananassa]